MRARGWDAVTLLAQGDTIPNYHWPTDTYENIDPPTVARALETGRELLGVGQKAELVIGAIGLGVKPACEQAQEQGDREDPPRQKQRFN